MINIDKCTGCDALCSLMERGLDSEAINSVGRTANYGAEVHCAGNPEHMEGGWTLCKAPEHIKGALLGAAAMHDIVTVKQAIESYVTV